MRQTPTRRVPPASNEVEVSLIGPGYGECVLLHVGHGEWVVVDSCIDHETGRPEALTYLDLMGVNAATQVKLLVASHWHDDHIRGFAELVASCPAARVAYSAALRQREFLRLVYASEFDLAGETSGIRELHQVLEILGSAGTDPFLATSGQLIWQASSGATIHALSPSNRSLVLALRAIAELLPRPLQPLRRVVHLGPNQAAVVLWVALGDVSVLLGGDLEVGTDPAAGWLAILAAGSPGGRAVVYKVAHHGSANADHPDIWSTLLTNEPWAVLVPFLNGGIALPTREDRQRICRHTTNAHITGPVHYPRRRRRDRLVDKIIDDVVVNIREVDGEIGHVRLRFVPNPPQNVVLDHFGSAEAMCR